MNNAIEASNSKLWNNEIAAEDRTYYYQEVHTLQLSVHDFFEANSSAKEVV